jgi:hypothetical protein
MKREQGMVLIGLSFFCAMSELEDFPKQGIVHLHPQKKGF